MYTPISMMDQDPYPFTGSVGIRKLYTNQALTCVLCFTRLVSVPVGSLIMTIIIVTVKES